MMLIAACFLIGLAGCHWFRKTKPIRETPVFKLTPFKLSENSIAVEIGILEISDDQAAKLDQLWAGLDNQMIQLDSRKVWDLNGLQAAVVPDQPPAIFWQLVDPPVEYLDDDDRFYKEKLRQSQGLPQQQNVVVLQNANLIAGKAHELPTGPRNAKLEWRLIKLEGRESGECQLAQCHFRIAAYHANDGGVRIRLTPQILHGEQKSRIAVNDDSFYREMSQDQLIFYDAAIEVPLQAGQTVLCGPTTTEGSGLGRLFFRSASAQRILFVRVTGIGGEHLFSSKESLQPLVTPLD